MSGACRTLVAVGLVEIKVNHGWIASLIVIALESTVPLLDTVMK
jgi:hypothetical protein